MAQRMKSIHTQLRKKGLELVQESNDPECGPVYTITPKKPGITNSDLAYRLYYWGETAKWSATRRKAIEKATNRINRIKAQEAASRKESSGSSSESS
ncbi:uncharacterized protein PV06_02321 [Exophiala oligosperma]|uniref:Uncharacterized protein n=2 Tax=Chaetothyriales TaxID=34395 RepID=A0A0D2DVM7_9EURO|nr:uncharacterized protein PV06_02321 [Exophiala oligosperma]KAJ9640566.1 hypothetical protein H2204_003194 [Knufia peltigerae]KIW46670.1 hypothetical protein PV06_02321 [Exophiala oligosperma]